MARRAPYEPFSTTTAVPSSALRGSVGPLPAVLHRKKGSTPPHLIVHPPPKAHAQMKAEPRDPKPRSK